MRLWLLSLVAASGLVVAAAPALAAEGRTVAELALRAEPTSSSELLLTIPAGSSLTLGRCSGAWCRVSWKSYSGYASRQGLAIAAATPTPGPVRGGITTADGSQLWPIFPPYPYRSGYYPKADWYYDIPPYVAIEPSFYRRRYFMIGQEHSRYRYMPHMFRGDHYSGGSIQDIDLEKISSGAAMRYESTITPATTIPKPTPTTPAPGMNNNAR